MRQRNILISENDLLRLRDEIHVARSSWYAFTPMVEVLEARLRRARVVAPQELSKETITMNSRFQVRDPQDDSASTYTLVYPLEADHERGKVSVLSPLGVAVLGAQVGDFIWWTEAGESRSGRIESLSFQPEAVGAHHL
jgi:regulator of nucleoside diphosphate kinase